MNSIFWEQHLPVNNPFINIWDREKWIPFLGSTSLIADTMEKTLQIGNPKVPSTQKDLRQWEIIDIFDNR